MQKIMFNDKYGLTTAVLLRRKTKTRRSCKDRATNELILASDVASYRYYPEENLVEFLMQDGSVKVSVPPYKIGEVVAVAQPYRDAFKGDWIKMQLHNDEAGFTNKMFVKADLMPHQIRILDFKVEPLQDISDEDCMKEGILKREIRPFKTIEIKYQVPKNTIYKDTPRAAFAVLIDKVSGKGTWMPNPYEFAYSFELVK